MTKERCVSLCLQEMLLYPDQLIIVWSCACVAAYRTKIHIWVKKYHLRITYPPVYAKAVTQKLSISGSHNEIHIESQ